MRTYYGTDDLPNEGRNPATCAHEWHNWRSSPGSSVVGGYCPRCGELQVD